eukprot:EG_transcript_41540
MASPAPHRRLVPPPRKPSSSATRGFRRPQRRTLFATLTVETDPETLPLAPATPASAPTPAPSLGPRGLRWGSPPARHSPALQQLPYSLRPVASAVLVRPRPADPPPEETVERRLIHNPYSFFGPLLVEVPRPSPFPSPPSSG